VWRACSATSKRWATEIRPMKTELHTCVVCFNEVLCAYVCVGSREVQNLHIVCAGC